MDWSICGVPVGTRLLVVMPCGGEALAEVVSCRYLHGTMKAEYLRVRWLEATPRTVRGYKVVWGKKCEGIESTLSYPPNPSEHMYGCVQMGDYRKV